MGNSVPTIEDRLAYLESRCAALEANFDHTQLQFRAESERIGMLEQNRRYKLELYKSPEGHLPDSGE